MFRTLPSADDPRCSIGLTNSLLHMDQHGLPTNFLRQQRKILPIPPQVPHQQSPSSVAPWLTPLAMAALNIPSLTWPWSPFMAGCNEWMQKQFSQESFLNSSRSIPMPPPPNVPGSRMPTPNLCAPLKRSVSFRDECENQTAMQCGDSSRSSGNNVARSTVGSTIPRRVRRPTKRSFIETTNSPVSGTIIRQVPKTNSNPESSRQSSSVTGGISNGESAESSSCKTVLKGDIESSLNCVEVTPEARAELAKIENRLGDYLCRLCHDKFEDAFQLAQHRCPCIVHIEYRCLQCDKVFHCPANLASHQRWHKPKQQSPINAASTQPKQINESSILTSEESDCDEMEKKKVVRKGVKEVSSRSIMSNHNGYNNNYDKAKNNLKLNKSCLSSSFDQSTDEYSQSSIGSRDSPNSDGLVITPTINLQPNSGSFSVASLLGMSDNILS